MTPHCARAIKTHDMSGAVGEGPGGLADTGNDLGSVPEPVDEVSAALDAPRVAANAATTAYGEEAVSVGMATEGGGGEVGGLEASLDLSLIHI